MKIIASAPAKAILFGEHAVNRKQSALAVSVGLRVRCTIETAPSGVQLRSGGHADEIERETLLALRQQIDGWRAAQNYEAIRQLARRDYFAAAKYIVASALADSPEVGATPPMPGLRIEWHSQIPSAGGLGSGGASFAALAYGLTALALRLGTPPLSAGMPPLSAETPPLRAGTPPLSAGTPPLRASMSALSAGTPPLSAGTPALSASTPPLRTGTPPERAGTPAESASMSAERAGTLAQRAGTPAHAAASEADAIEERRIGALAWLGDVVAHGGVASALDTQTALHGGVIRYTVERWGEPVPFHPDLALVIGNTGLRGSTAEVNSGVREWLAADPTRMRYFEMIGLLSRAAAQPLAQGDWSELGKLMNLNQLVLEKIGVSCEALERLIQAALATGAYGAKLSGSGGGGIMIALTTAERKEAVAAAIRAAGGEALCPQVAVPGAQLEETMS